MAKKQRVRKRLPDEAYEQLNVRVPRSVLRKLQKTASAGRLGNGGPRTQAAIVIAALKKWFKEHGY